MQTFPESSVLGPAICWGIWLAAIFAQPAPSGAQPPQQHVFLPPALAGTPASFQVEAVAKYLVAQGDLAESIAIARKIHAEAVALEMQNWVNYVDAYFERREKWRQWRRKENPTYLQREAYRQEVIKKRIETQYQDVVKGDVTEHLNWLLAELFGPMAYQYFSGSQGVSDWPVSDDLKQALAAIAAQRLKEEDLHLIRFNAGGLEFPANDSKVLGGFWPVGLRGPEFETRRAHFEEARDEALAKLRTGDEVSHENGQNLVRAVNDLFVALDEAYPPDARKEISVSLTYHEAQRYLRSLLFQVHRLIRTHDHSAFDGSLCFEAGTLLDLLQHMYRTGVVFAPPEAGGQRVYQGILMPNMRNIYMALGSEKASYEQP